MDWIDILSNDFDASFLSQKIKQIIELKIFELYRQLIEKKKNFINSFDFQGDEFDLERLEQIKNNLKINFNKETGKIDVT